MQSHPPSSPIHPSRPEEQCSTPPPPHPPRPKRGPKSGPESGPIRRLKRGPKRGPESGPKSAPCFARRFARRFLGVSLGRAVTCPKILPRKKGELLCPKSCATALRATFRRTFRGPLWEAFRATFFRGPPAGPHSGTPGPSCVGDLTGPDRSGLWGGLGALWRLSWGRPGAS